MFVLPWHLHLHRVNVKLNQTIQILKVVPMSLLPVGHKENREFLQWVTMKASEMQANEDP